MLCYLVIILSYQLSHMFQRTPRLWSGPQSIVSGVILHIFPKAILVAAILIPISYKGSFAALQTSCVTDAEVEAAVIPQIQAGRFAIDTRNLAVRPLCSGVPLSEKVQEIASRVSPKANSSRPRYFNQGELPQFQAVPNSQVASQRHSTLSGADPSPSSGVMRVQPKTASNPYAPLADVKEYYLLCYGFAIKKDSKVDPNKLGPVLRDNFSEADWQNIDSRSDAVLAKYRKLLRTKPLDQRVLDIGERCLSEFR